MPETETHASGSLRLTKCELPLRETFYPMGFPLVLETNSEQVIQVAAEAWGIFTQSFAEPPVTLSLEVSGSAEAELPPAPKFQWRDHLMTIVCDEQNHAVCDFIRNSAYGWLTKAVANVPHILRPRFLQATGLSLLTNAYLAPVHGALIVRDGCGVMLCGESFAGKSTLAYACARAGWTLVSDDGTFLVRKDPGRYGMGNPQTIRFREDARLLFPELAGRIPVVRPNGKLGMEVLTKELAISVATGSRIDHIVFLDRSSPGPPRLERYSKDDALPGFERLAHYGLRESRAAMKLAYRRLLDARMWEMHYHDLNGAIACLEQLPHRKGLD